MATVNPEKLVPLINVARKLRACDPVQQWDVMQRMPRLFQSHGSLSVLADIMFSALCDPKFSQKIPAALYVDIETILPPDDELNLEDSIYESQFVESPVNANQNHNSSNQMKRFPMSLVRFPTFIQCRVFNFLRQRDLWSVQKVCRALCIAARNPLCLHTIYIKDGHHTNQHLADECYSKPKVMRIGCSGEGTMVWNTKWGDNVVDLHIDSSSVSLQEAVPFTNLQNCRISEELNSDPQIFISGIIASYSTLKELTLVMGCLTKNIIDCIRKFKNLEILYLWSEDSEPFEEHELDVISLPKLKEFGFSDNALDGKGGRHFERFLLGSHPERVMIEPYQKRIQSQSEEMIEALCAIRQFNINYYNLEDDGDFLDSVSELLEKAPIRNQAMFEESKIEAISDELYLEDPDINLLSSISTFFQWSKKSVLELSFGDERVEPPYEVTLIPNDICKAPYGTFTEVTVDVGCELMTRRHVGQLQAAMYAWNGDECVDESLNRMALEIIDYAEQWMRPWLMFNEEVMKKIGLRALDINFRCYVRIRNEDDSDIDLKENMSRLRAILVECFKSRAEAWDDIDERCSTTSERDLNLDKYSVVLSLRSH